MKKKLLIEGMSCGHCVNHVKTALEELETVNSAEVNLEGKFAVVEGTDGLTDAQLKNAVEEEAGYTLVKIQNQ